MYPIRIGHHRGFVAISGIPGVALATQRVALVTHTKCHLCDMHHEGRPCSAYCEQCWRNGCGRQEHPTWKHDEWVEAQKKLMGVSTSRDSPRRSRPIAVIHAPDVGAVLAAACGDGSGGAASGGDGSGGAASGGSDGSKSKSGSRRSSCGSVHVHYHFHGGKPKDKKDDSSPHWHHPMAKAYGIPARRYR